MLMYRIEKLIQFHFTCKVKEKGKNMYIYSKGRITVELIEKKILFTYHCCVREETDEFLTLILK